MRGGFKKWDPTKPVAAAPRSLPIATWKATNSIPQKNLVF
jgi:hypothetical protein